MPDAAQYPGIVAGGRSWAAVTMTVAFKMGGLPKPGLASKWAVPVEAPATSSQHIVIVMAVFHPDTGFLAQQVESLAAQTHRNFTVIFVISDTVSHALVRELAHDNGLSPRIVTPDHELDPVRAFEKGLVEALSLTKNWIGPEPYIALCDQDDIWRPDRLAQGVAALRASHAMLVHSDARIVDQNGRVLHASMFTFERRRKRPGLRGLLYRNNVTGMTVLMRRQLIERALPFPAQSGVHYFHDLWLGLLAEAAGGTAFINAPLVDYRQHKNNAVGARRKPPKWPVRALRDLRPVNMNWLRREAATYALARYLSISLQRRLANGIADQPGGGTTSISPSLWRMDRTTYFLFDAVFLALRGRLSLARTAAGFALVRVGRVVWAARQLVSDALPAALGRFDELLFNLTPGNQPEPVLDTAVGARAVKNACDVADGRKSPAWRPVFTPDHPALTILVPTLNPTEVFAGIATAVDVGLGLAARGIPVRFIATDLPISSLEASRRFILGRMQPSARAQGGADLVSLHCGLHEGEVPAHRGDVFLATAWWSAHVADTLIKEFGYRQAEFLYLIQDFEPNFYPWGQEFADASASYALNFRPIFNTTTLRSYFAENGFSFATADSLAFRPSIDIARYAGGTRCNPGGRARRIAIYGRPEVARNMFETAVEALSTFVTQQAIGPDDVELVSIGLKHQTVQLPNHVKIKSLGKLSWEDYPEYLLGVDVGLCLMYSPHPSHLPIEMAASGVRVVTNSFGPKDLSKLSPAILSAPPSSPEIARALARAWAMPAVTGEERQVEMALLGATLDETVGALADDLRRTFDKGRERS